MYNKFKAMICVAALGLSGVSCSDTTDLENSLTDLEGRVESLEKAISEANSDIVALNAIAKSDIFIVGYTATESGYTLELSSTESSQTVEVTYGSELPAGTLAVSIDENGNWIFSTDAGTSWNPIAGADNAHNPDGALPQLNVDSENYWCISFDGTNYERILDSAGKPISASATADASIFKNVEYNDAEGSMDFTLVSGAEISIPVIETFYMNVKGYTAEQVICLNETLNFEVEMSSVESAHIMDLPGWAITLEDTQLSITGPASGEAGVYEVKIFLVSTDNLMKTVSLKFTLNPVTVDANAVKQYADFVAGNDENVLLDFSYAGYNHGETAPAQINIVKSGNSYTASNGYTVYNIEDWGANGADEETDRKAFIDMLTEVLGAPTLNAAGDQLTFPHSATPRNIIFYFPEGNFILHTSADDADGKSQSVVIRGSNIILKGAGRDKTKITMADPNLPSQGESVMYSSPDMIQLKHNTGIQYSTVLANVTADAAKGSFSVTVDAASGISEGDWVCLYLKNADTQVVAEELAPYTASSSWEIAKTGVVVKDLHQVKAVSGNTVTFYEPIMHVVKADYGWDIVRYQHYENIGVEDITFVGNAKENFVHHGSWEDDGAYKPLSINRAVNSWMRRVDFVSVSEACSVIECANVSVYDCTISGNRGHAAIRSQASSRVFIGAVTDRSTGYTMNINGNKIEGTDPTVVAGQYHAMGVSKESMGAVIWRNTWGSDSCFESHATQPRATLIDACTGSFRMSRQGGDAVQMPNHLADLTIWNFDNTTAYTGGTWIWWNENSQWWKFLPPVIVGFHGESIDFDESQVTVDSSNGTPVEPQSLYEAQLRNRLGYVPAWLNSLK